jgi:hypothetical protein
MRNFILSMVQMFLLVSTVFVVIVGSLSYVFLGGRI